MNKRKTQLEILSESLAQLKGYEFNIKKCKGFKNPSGFEIWNKRSNVLLMWPQSKRAKEILEELIQLSITDLEGKIKIVTEKIHEASKQLNLTFKSKKRIWLS